MVYFLNLRLISFIIYINYIIGNILINFINFYMYIFLKKMKIFILFFIIYKSPSIIIVNGLGENIVIQMQYSYQKNYIKSFIIKIMNG